MFQQWGAILREHPGAETCMRLIFVINCILVFGLYINYKNMHSINNIKCFAQFTVFTQIYNGSVQHLTFRKYLH